VPGFAVLIVEAGAAVLLAAEQEAGAADGADRNDVPGVFGDDVGGDEVDFAGQIGDGAASAAAVGVDAVEAVEELSGTLDLDAPDEREGVERAERGRRGGVLGCRVLGCRPARGATAAAGGPRSSTLRAGGEIVWRGCGELWGSRHRGTRVSVPDFAGVEHEVVAFAVAVGLGDAEAHASGDKGEDEFGKLSATLGGAFAAERMDVADRPQVRRWKASG